MLDNIKTIVLLMFENRSFDNMLGHLSYSNINKNVDGLSRPLSQYQNVYNTTGYNPFPIKTDIQLSTDLPHEKEWVTEQINKNTANGKYSMDGFVKAYMEFTGAPPNNKSDPLGFYIQLQVPITSFLASNYCVCDKFFASLPTSTQPNRTMAFCGDTTIDSTKTQLIDATGNIFDWMEKAGVKWRVYHDGLSFFVLYNQLWKYVLGENFRDYESLYADFQSEPDDSFPEVIIVEPSYQDAPHFGSDQPNDNHPPLAIGFGEEFLRRTYEAVICNLSRWGNTLMLVYYDEHGGFFDHVPPPPIGYSVAGKGNYHFESLGVRIPAIIISPYVEKGTVNALTFDHTSVLQLLAEKFTPGVPYSATVENRRAAGINSLSASLLTHADTTAPPAPTVQIFAKTALGGSIATTPQGAMAKAFEGAALNMIADNPTGTKAKYPELSQWKDIAQKTRNTISI